MSKSKSAAYKLYKSNKSDFAKLSKMAKTSTTKKTSKRKSTPESAIQKITWRGTPFPRVLNTTFTYSNSFTLNVVSGGQVASAIFSTNDIFDCYPAATNPEQPRFFDTLLGANGTAAPYRNFRVFSSKCELEMYAAGGNGAVSVYGLGAMNNTSSVALSIPEMRERADYKTGTIGLAAGGHDLAKMKRFITNKYLFGIKDLRDDEGTVGDFETSPDKLGEWVVSVGTMDSTAAMPYYCTIKITYYVQLFNRNDVIDS